MHSQIFFDCTEMSGWSRCLLSGFLAFALHLIKAHGDATYWLLISLYSFDFFCGLGCALAGGSFCPRIFKGGIRKLLGYVLLIVPLLLADHFLAENPHLAVYLYLKNWCLLYMSTVEMISIANHLRTMGLPIPTLESLGRFRRSLKNLDK